MTLQGSEIFSKIPWLAIAPLWVFSASARTKECWESSGSRIDTSLHHQNLQNHRRYCFVKVVLQIQPDPLCDDTTRHCVQFAVPDPWDCPSPLSCLYLFLSTPFLSVWFPLSDLPLPLLFPRMLGSSSPANLSRDGPGLVSGTAVVVTAAIIGHTGLSLSAARALASLA